MMLIDADKVKKCLEYDKLNHCEEQDGMEDWELLDVRYSQGFNAGIDRAIYYLENKNMQVAERHGHWIHVDELPSGDYFKCSECNNHIFLKFGWKVSFESPADEYHYCSLCGAKMDGDTK